MKEIQKAKIGTTYKGSPVCSRILVETCIDYVSSAIFFLLFQESCDPRNCSIQILDFQLSTGGDLVTGLCCVFICMFGLLIITDKGISAEILDYCFR